mmetsp:Transcript_7374/g.9975  ORF Transcript_7374/g.9975 Transcript_7374/m.9975 type:complete len:240 (+) Transcript_7374:108-827(+)|eukprot:CAMPEP_0196575180 /NCGR_PEP_ID=MMETSP1081-20130531/4708_1 /TAXON_ID=36882 /ORGANISM="Pyramimonas amylifera, Strain CCMP720" /LENGTH=239 /DNA_ID=CAMNT_0041893393 /DNA_START=365 /DNA_END=1084 /DNA_ORIENTATION=+
MGAGASAANNDPKYALPISRDDDTVGARTLFLCAPLNDNIKQKATQVLLEVSSKGFRLLRMESEEPLFDFPFPQVHSWGHLPNRFSYRFYEEKTKAIVLYAFETKFVDELLAVIHTTIDGILSARKTKSMSPEEFTDLLERLQICPEEDRLAQVKTACSLNFFSSEQGQQLVDELINTFDKVEAAATLHFSLVDQNHFSIVLRSLDQDDRENVLHRVTAEKTRQKNLKRAPATTPANLS